MLEAIYSEAGYRTGVYTSPHLVYGSRSAAGLAGRGGGCPMCWCRRSPRSSGPGKAWAVPSDDGEVMVLTYFEFTTLAILRTLSRQRASMSRFWRWVSVAGWMR